MFSRWVSIVLTLSLNEWATLFVSSPEPVNRKTCISRSDRFSTAGRYSAKRVGKITDCATPIASMSASRAAGAELPATSGCACRGSNVPIASGNNVALVNCGHQDASAGTTSVNFQSESNLKGLGAFGGAASYNSSAEKHPSKTTRM